MNGKKWLVALLSVMLVFLFAGCDLEQLSTQLTAQGREYGQTYTGKDDDTLTSSFFSFQVTSAALVPDFADYVPDNPDHAFLVLDMHIVNVFKDDDSIPMFSTDFDCSWGEGEDRTTVFPEDHFDDSMLPDEWTMLKNDKTDGKLVFIVPADQTQFEISYVELWDDDFEGNTYTILVTPDRSALEAGVAA